MKCWFEFRALAQGAEIAIYDEIGAFGIPAKAFLDELKALAPAADLTLRINSPGGSVFDGVAIYNALKRHDGRVTVLIDGIAASIASMIAMAGDEVVMPANTMLMLHDPSGLVMGTAADMRGMAEALDKMKAGMVGAYRDKSGRDDAEIEALMRAETWLTAEEAIDLYRRVTMHTAPNSASTLVNWHTVPMSGGTWCGTSLDTKQQLRPREFRRAFRLVAIN
jgi:ATP-dependent protease ClpP protease subunit